MPTEQKSCPYCGSVMAEAYFIIGGGVWCCEDKEYMECHVAGELEKYSTAVDECNSIVTPPSSLHCIIGSKGWHGGHEKWPKEGLFCKKCLTFVINPLPR
jgi:hypothetical protein